MSQKNIFVKFGNYQGNLLIIDVMILQVHGQKAGWEDPVEWVRGTLPWPSAQQDQAKLFHLPPPSIDSSSPGQSLEERTHKETPPSSMESDPLVRLSIFL